MKLDRGSIRWWVVHKILVSAPVPIGPFGIRTALGLGLGLGLRGPGLGLDNKGTRDRGHKALVKYSLSDWKWMLMKLLYIPVTVNL